MVKVMLKVMGWVEDTSCGLSGWYVVRVERSLEKTGNGEEDWQQGCEYKYMVI